MREGRSADQGPAHHIDTSGIKGEQLGWTTDEHLAKGFVDPVRVNEQQGERCRSLRGEEPCWIVKRYCSNFRSMSEAV